MGRTPCCNKKGLKRGPWTPEEDDILTAYINKNGHGTWRSLPKLVGLLRCGKSCRLRWTNYLRPDIKRGGFTVEEEKLVIQLHGILGNRWAAIASQLQGRTDNDIKNLWNTHLKKRLGLDSKTRQPLTPSTRHMAQWESARLQAEARLSRESSLVYPPTPPAPASTSTTADHFLRIWNSDVGESFRTFYHPRAQTSPAAASASASDQASVSAETTAADHISPSLAACSAATPSSNQNEDDQYRECKSCKSYNTTHEDHFIAAQLSSSSSVQSDDDSSDSTLQFLLDFPINNDISFLQEGNNMDDN